MDPVKGALTTFQVLKLGLAVDAERGHRASEQPLVADASAARFTPAIFAFLNTVKRVPDFVHQPTFSVSHAQGHVAVGLVHSQIERVRVTLPDVGEFLDHVSRLSEQGFQLLRQGLVKLSDLFRTEIFIGRKLGFFRRHVQAFLALAAPYIRPTVNTL